MGCQSKPVGIDACHTSEVKTTAETKIISRITNGTRQQPQAPVICRALYLRIAVVVRSCPIAAGPLFYIPQARPSATPIQSSIVTSASHCPLSQSADCVLLLAPQSYSGNQLVVYVFCCYSHWLLLPFCPTKQPRLPQHCWRTALNNRLFVHTFRTSAQQFTC